MIFSEIIKTSVKSQESIYNLVSKVEEECNSLKEQGNRIISISIQGSRAIIFAEKEEELYHPATRFDLFKENMSKLLDKWRKEKKINFEVENYVEMLDILRNVIEVEKLVYIQTERWQDRCSSCFSFELKSCRCKNIASKYYMMFIDEPYNTNCDGYSFVCSRHDKICKYAVYQSGQYTCGAKAGNTKPCGR
ncbi:MAG: hypothetical protein K0Q47_56 [Sedimentibacter sp.]|jgi:hypothetical protein|nr:hypothetical protein [Sedimentibacter sp.]